MNDPESVDPATAGGRWIPSTRLGKLGHIVSWIALFYLLTWGFARLWAWLSP